MRCSIAIRLPEGQAFRQDSGDVWTNVESSLADALTVLIGVKFVVRTADRGVELRLSVADQPKSTLIQ